MNHFSYMASLYSENYKLKMLTIACDLQSLALLNIENYTPGGPMRICNKIESEVPKYEMDVNFHF